MTRRAGLAAAWLVVVTACAAPSPPESKLRPRTPVPTAVGTTTRIIGLVGTMSGPNAVLGSDAFEGADLSVHVLNQHLGRGAPPFELVTRDDHGDPGIATLMLRQLATSERTVGIVYAGPSEALERAEQALELSGVPLFVCYADLAGRLDGHLFQMSPPTRFQSRRLASYIVRDRRYDRVGVLASRSLDGATAVTALRRELHRLGAGSPAVARVAPEADPWKALRRLRSAGSQAVVVAGAPSLFHATVQTLRARNAVYRTSARARSIRAGRSGPARWHPQIMGFDLAMTSARGDASPPVGTVASDTYGRGAFYLPVPNFRAFRRAFLEWWGSEPFGWQRRSYDAVQMIGWAAARTPAEADITPALERMRDVRFAGLGITLGPRDHTVVDEPTVGLWVVPRPGTRVRERRGLHAPLPWVPLARGFATTGGRTRILADDVRYLFPRSRGKSERRPKATSMLFGVTTGRSDPVH